MGKPLMTQRRGKGSPSFKAPSHKFKTKVAYITLEKEQPIQKAQITNLVDDPARTTVLMQLKYETGQQMMLPAFEGATIGQTIQQGPKAEIKMGSILPIEKISEGYPIYNIEVTPGDGGKLARSSGSICFIISKTNKIATVKLPSGKIKKVHLKCRATVGNAAGGGRTKKPMLKAGVQHYKRKAKNQLFPIVRGVKMNPYDHPFGGKQHHGAKTKKGKGGSPGQHVGSFGAKRTGRKKK